MEAELRSWLIDAGFPKGIVLTAMHGGMGSTEMWSFVPAPEASALVIRVFGEGATDSADREFLAMDIAARHGLPVPAIVTHGAVMNRPLLVTTFIEGTLANQVFASHPEQAYALGTVMGETLGRLHEVIAPDGLGAKNNAWIDRGGPALADIRSLLEAVPNQDRLLHLDYHPLNVLLHDGCVSGIIDWENTAAGPPPMDLARTRAILKVAMLGNLMPPPLHKALAEFERGLVAGHAQVIGDDPSPELSAAWGLAMTVEDLAHQSGKPGIFVTLELLAHLAAERDALIRTFVDGEVR